MAKRSKRNLEAEIDDLREDASLLNTMTDSLSYVLAEKGVITQADRKIKQYLNAMSVFFSA